ARGLGLAFDAGEPGEARVKFGTEGLEAASDWLPARPLRPAGGASVLRLCYVPEGDGRAPLRALLPAAFRTDHVPAPAGTAAATARSGIPAAHPEWLLKNAAGPIVWDTRDDWGGKVYSLDGAHPEVQAWLRELARRIVRDWGYDYVKIDFLLWATAGTEHFGGLTHAEAYRAGLAAIRDGLGPEAFLLGCGAPLQHAVGYVNGMRIGTDVDASWGGLEAPA